MGQPRQVMPRNTLAGEKWRPVEGLEDCFEVSNLGRVYSLPRVAMDGREVKGKFLTKSKIQSKNSFICRVLLAQWPQKFRVRIDKLVWETFRDPIPKGLIPYPLDGDPSNCALSNLGLRPKQPGASLYRNRKQETADARRSHRS